MNFDHDAETQLANLTAYVRGELGYDAEFPGALRRQVEEHEQMIRTIDDTLRGRGDDLGLVGWSVVLRRTWITLVALLGAALGYVANDVVDAFGDQARARSETSAPGSARGSP